MIRVHLEYHNQKLLFLGEILQMPDPFGLTSVGIIIFSLVIRVPGYKPFEGMDTVDAFLNAVLHSGPLKAEK
jgi:hypothetical protein